MNLDNKLIFLNKSYYKKLIIEKVKIFSIEIPYSVFHIQKGGKNYEYEQKIYR